MFTFDTNALIYYFQGKERLVNFIKEHKDDLFFIPSIVITEFLSFPSLDKESEKNFFLNLVDTMIIINLDFEIAKYASILRRKYNLKTVDSIIPSSAILTNTTLITYNLKDFKKIKELKLLTPN